MLKIKDWIYEHRRLVCGFVASIILLVILASCVAGQGLVPVNGDNNQIIVEDVLRGGD